MARNRLALHRPAGLADIANLGLTLSDAKELLARVQQVMVAAQARDHEVRRPSCGSCAGQCHLKDWRPRRIATPFGEVVPRLRRWLCADCGRIETGIDWPENCRSTPELNELRAHLSALLTYRVAAGVLVAQRQCNCGDNGHYQVQLGNEEKSPLRLGMFMRSA